MKILVLNSGSSSLKYQVINTETGEMLVKGNYERIGQLGAFLTHKVNGEKHKFEHPAKNHEEAVQFIMRRLTSENYGIFKSLDELEAIGHRVVHGGEKFKESVVITDEVIQEIKNNEELAPLHNPSAILGIEACKKVVPGKPMVAVFDTSFHQTISKEKYIYAIPYQYYEKYGIRKYGFHGTSHQYVANRVANLMKKDIKDLKIVNCHLGQGASICAIKDGKSKDKIAESSDITLHELNKILDLGSQNDKIYREVYEEYESVYLSKHLEVFLKEIKNKNLKKALKTSGIEKSELDSAYNSGKNGDERFTKFYNDYLNFKISCYITQIIRGKTVSKALKNSNLTDEELKDNLKEIESRIIDKQMNSVIGEIAKNRTTRQAAKKARIRIDEVYRWYLEGKKGNEKFKDFADIYHELYVEVGCEIFQNFLNKGKTPKQILKIMNEDITREDYEFWIKNDLISDKNVEAKLYTEDEIKEKIENEGFRQKEEKSLSGLSIIGC